MALDPSQLAEPQESSARRRRLRPGRLLAYLAMIWVLVTLNFLLPRAMPGDPISAMVSLGGQNASLGDPERQALARYYGLHRSLVSQYGHYLGGLARGDLGRSIRHNRPVADLLRERLPWTVLLAGTGVTLSTALGLVAGVHSGWKRGRRLDAILLAAFTGLRGVPPFFLASIALFVFGAQLRWVPLGGATTPFADRSGLAAVADVAHHLVLPAACMALLFASGTYLIMRAAMVGEAGADHLVLGRAKGLRERRLKYGYAARNALLPLVTLTALELGLAVSGGLIFIEQIFAYPGVGALLVEAANLRDYPTLQGAFLVLGIFVVSLNALADIAYGRLDPRVRG